MSDEDWELPEYEECTIEMHAAESGGYIATAILADESQYPREDPVSWDELNPKLLEAGQDPRTYGAALYEAFLTGRTGDGLAVARVRAHDARKGVRLRLNIPPDARRLHGLNWEWLYDPQTSTTFAASPDYALSRFLIPTGPAGGDLANTQPLRILIVISNPKNLDVYNVPALDPQVEHDRMAEALARVAGQVEYRFLQGPATPQNIRDHLERETFHVVHVMAHGYFERTGFLLLEDTNGNAQKVDESTFADMLQGQRQIRLVVLAACLSAARSQISAFAGLAPALVARGVPAVVAMGGVIEIGAAQAFVEHFYRQLSKHGVVDAAVNYARFRLKLDPQRRNHLDWGCPVLFMNTRRGQLYAATPADVDAFLPPDLRSPMLLKVLRQFVDRTDQQDKLHAMVKTVVSLIYKGGLANIG